MPKPGPIPQPAALRSIAGGRDPSHRPPSSAADFRPEIGEPSIPHGLSIGARKVWKRLAPELVHYGLLSVVFSDAFEDLCETLSDVRTLRRALRARQALLQQQGRDESEAWEVSTPNGMRVQSPLALNLRHARIDAQRLLDKFGLSPAEQARVSVGVRTQLKLAFGTEQAPSSFADFQ